MTDNKSNTFSMRSILEKEKLNGENFLNWYQNLRRVLEQEGTLYVLNKILPPPPSADSTMAEKLAFMKHDNDASDVAWLIFFSMTPEIQLLHDEKNAFDMVENMKHRYHREIRQERYELSKTLFRCRYLQQKDSVEIHLQKMKGCLDRLENLGYPLGQELARDLVLQSLPASLSQYIIENRLNEIDESLPVLFQTIKDAEKEISKISPNTSSITQCSKMSDICHTTEKTEGVNVVGVPLQTKNELEPTGDAAGKGICFHCGEKGHWKRNCKIYLEELKKNKESVSGNSGTKELQHATEECKSLKRKAEVEGAKFTPAPKTKKNNADQSTTKGPASLSQYIIENKLNEIDESLPVLFQTIKDAEKEISKISPDTSSTSQCSKTSDIFHTTKKTEGVNVVGVPLQNKNKLEATGDAAGKGNCFHCGEKGHWKRNCKIYLEELKKNKESVSGKSGTEELQHATKECNLLKRKAEVEGAKFTPAPKMKTNTADQSTTKGPPLPKKDQSSKKTISVTGNNPTKEQTVISKCASCGRLHPGECLFSMLATVPLPKEMPNQTSYSTNPRNIEIQQQPPCI